MQVVTTRNKPKPFAWSYSRLKNFESCPKRHWHLDIQKDIKEEEGEALLWGNVVHKALADRVAKSVPLPKAMADYEKWAERILTGGGNILVEQKLAITKDFAATSWFGDTAWYRGIGDVIKIVGPVALIVDYKTGSNRYPDMKQLKLMALMTFAHFPQIKHVKAGLLFVAHDNFMPEEYSINQSEQLWGVFASDIARLEHSVKSDNWPPNPTPLCRWCPVVSCEFHKE